MEAVYIALVIYLLILAFLITRARKQTEPYRKKGEPVYLSVVIPVKDEPNLSLLLADLSDQRLKEEYYEVIVVNDHSNSSVSVKGQITLLSLKENEHGKKIALTRGIETSKGNVIVTIDGDCRIEEDFLESIYELFSYSDVVLSPGLVTFYDDKKPLTRLQLIENYAIMGTGLALAKSGFTSLSNGANLSFRKDIWKEIGGYKDHSHIPSGDDEFLVQEISKKYPDKVFFRSSQDSIVTTKSAADLKTFFNQRIRWAGKWRYYSNFKMKVVAVLTFIIHFLICIGLIFLLMSGNKTLYILFIVKIILEGWLIIMMAGILKKRTYPLAFIVLQFLYSPYVVLFGITSNFVNYNWKGRNYRY